ncbi:hypothetical protein OIU77_017885 [Salix suchowensis]|uniref:Uncharacterized protein n=1 Tax=Salix suchowensis TaxID=1278906 RepID=A0ABQ8ZQA9_9ROSI|nr:hypothetical protein OIU77_017885 [Salix suchowensis]
MLLFSFRMAEFDTFCNAAGSTKQNHFLGSQKNGLFYQPSTHHFPRRNYMQCQCLSARKLSHSLAHQFLHPPYYSRISKLSMSHSQVSHFSFI